MAFAGLKKQINKANQYVTEKMGGAEGTKLDYDFMEMERKTDVTVELVEELQTKTKEYLQPNPTARARMQAVKGISKLSGQAKSNTYPQPEGTLAECMLTYGKKLGDDSIFAQSLVEMGDSLKQMADVKYALDDRVKQNFLEPLHSLQTKDLKEVMHHRKKLQGRRLDFDCKRRRQAKAGSNITDDEIRGAEEKFAESWQLAQMGMYNLLENDVEQVSQLCVFAEAMYEYHEQCTELLKVLVEVLNQKREEAADRPKSDFQPKTLADLNVDSGSTHGSDGVNAYHISAKSTNPIMYSSQQNLSTLATTTGHNRNVHNINSSHNFNNNNTKVYGSQQSLSTSSNRSTSFNTNAKLSNNTTATNAANKYNNNNHINSSSNNGSSQNNNNNNNVDNWLNAWDNPNPPIPATRMAVVPKQTNKKFSKQFSDPWAASPLPSPMRSPAKTPNPQVGPCCTALYDFEPENPGELGFKENDVIQLINKVDENWYEGSVRGRTGYFPQSYVTVTVPLP